MYHFLYKANLNLIWQNLNVDLNDIVIVVMIIIVIIKWLTHIQQLLCDNFKCFPYLPI